MHTKTLQDQLGGTQSKATRVEQDLYNVSICRFPGTGKQCQKTMVGSGRI